MVEIGKKNCNDHEEDSLEKKKNELNIQETY